MPHYKKGPIQFYSFGKFVIDGEEHSEDKHGTKGKGKDIRLIGKQVSEWQERQGHLLKPEMITGIYDEDIDVLIIAAGADKALKCPKKVIKKIKHHGIGRVIVKRSPKACKIYNRLYRKGVKVALLAHGTC
jgi:hypothetical protein